MPATVLRTLVEGRSANDEAARTGDVLSTVGTVVAGEAGSTESGASADGDAPWADPAQVGLASDGRPLPRHLFLEPSGPAGWSTP